MNLVYGLSYLWHPPTPNWSRRSKNGKKKKKKENMRPNPNGVTSYITRKRQWGGSPCRDSLKKGFFRRNNTGNPSCAVLISSPLHLTIPQARCLNENLALTLSELTFKLLGMLRVTGTITMCDNIGARSLTSFLHRRWMLTTFYWWNEFVSL